MTTAENQSLVVIPGVDPVGSYDPEVVFPVLTAWLKAHYQTDVFVPFFLDEGGLTFHRIFFLEAGQVVAAFTMSGCYDPASPTLLSGIVVDADWGDSARITPFLDALTNFGRAKEYGFITVPTRIHSHHRQFLAHGYELYATSEVIEDGPTLKYYRADLGVRPA